LQELEAELVGRRPQVARRRGVERPVGQVGALDASGDIGARAACPRDPLDMSEISLVGPRIRVAREEPDRSELFVRESL
jgi:hypothetical protein